MFRRRHVVLAVSVTVAGAAFAQGPAPRKPAAPPPPRRTAPQKLPARLTETQQIVHALNRLGFGPRPGDVERVRQIGLRAWIERQLAPETIDDAALDARLSDFRLVALSGPELGDLEEAVRKGNAQTILRAKQRASQGEGMAEMGRREALARLTDDERRQMADAQRARRDLAEAGRQFVTEKIVRAAHSERQLNEVLVDFWSNHFNIDISKARIVKIADEREVVRRHAMGRFSDLLMASAKSPAMLIYLDNYQSVAPMPETSGARGRRPRTARGLNENYARELLELHTLGVDGGYTQKDVQEVARCLTGWTLRSRYSGAFVFDPRRHDRGEKTVLGKTIPAGGGIEDGEAVIAMLANHPSTMRFVSRKLCVRLVSDNPPEALVDRCVATWKRTGGDIREVVRTIVLSPEFMAPDAYRAKIKSPFELAVSAVRALGAQVRADGKATLAYGNGGARPGDPRSLEGQINLLGQPLFRYAFPTGWPEDSQKWVSSGALIGRINFALALTGGRIDDVTLGGTATRAAEGKQGAALVDALAGALLHGDLSAPTRATLIRQCAQTPSDPTAAAVDPARRIAALILGSPEFQRR